MANQDDILRDRNAIYAAMVATESDEMDFYVKRETRQPDTTLSAYAMEALQTEVYDFIHARIAAHWDKLNGHQLIRAEVRITVDDQHIVPDEAIRPWWVIDGNRRLDA
jgi:hypothetical protein